MSFKEKLTTYIFLYNYMQSVHIQKFASKSTESKLSNKVPVFIFLFTAFKLYTLYIRIFLHLYRLPRVLFEDICNTLFILFILRTSIEFVHNILARPSFSLWHHYQAEQKAARATNGEEQEATVHT